MKKNIFSVKWGIALLVTTAFMASCYEDKGNYSYQDMAEITVKGIEPVYQIMFGDALEITPVIEQKQAVAVAESDLEFLWLNLGPISNQRIIDTLHRGKNVDGYLEKLKVGDNQVMLQVRNLKTGVKYYSDYFVIEVALPSTDVVIKQGFMLLLNDNGKTDLRFINYDPAIANAVKLEMSEIPVNAYIPDLGAPKDIACYFDQNSPGLGGYSLKEDGTKQNGVYYSVTLLTDKGLNKLSPIDHRFVEDYSMSYFTVGDFSGINITNIVMPSYYPRTNGETVMLRDDQDNLMFYRGGNVGAGQVFVPWMAGVYCNRYANKNAEGVVTSYERFQPAKVLAYNNTFVAVLFDKTTRSFVFKANVNNYCEKFTAPEPDFKFNNNDPGFEPIWMRMRNDNYLTGSSALTVYALTKNSAGEMDMLLFQPNATSSLQKKWKIWPQNDNGTVLTGINNARLFALDGMTNYATSDTALQDLTFQPIFYYGTNNEIYCYHLSDRTLKKVFTAPSGSTIVDMKFVTFQSMGNNAFKRNFVVVTKGSGANSTCVEIYTVATLDGTLTLREFTNANTGEVTQCRWDGLPDYVNIEWKGKP